MVAGDDINQVLAETIIDQSILNMLMAVPRKRGVDLVELFAERSTTTSASLDDGKVEQVVSNTELGAGIRVVIGKRSGYAHTTDLSERGLLTSLEAAMAIADGTDKTLKVEIQPAMSFSKVSKNSKTDVPTSKKVDLLIAANESAKSYSSNISQVSAGYSDVIREVQIANSDGHNSTNTQVRTSFVVSCIATRDSVTQSGFSTLRKSIGFELFDTQSVEDVAKESARIAVVKLGAKDAPAGPMPVVIKKGAGGVLFHEACGHGLEADAIAKQASVYAGQLGTEVASKKVTLVDDGTLDSQWGSYAIDDEGHLAKRNVLIENGQLTDYMWDFIRAKESGVDPKGNGRRQSYQYMPMVRMTNTFITNGTDKSDDLISDLSTGIYVAGLGGGNVNVTTGDFVFSMTESYLIENGQLTHPLKDAVLIGNGPEVLRNIDGVADDFAFGWGGTCGKAGQGVPVGTGQPTVLVKTGLSVGGVS